MWKVTFFKICQDALFEENLACVCTHMYICVLVTAVLLLLLFLKGTVGGLPDLFDVGHGLCDGAWLGID